MLHEERADIMEAEQESFDVLFGRESAGLSHWEREAVALAVLLRQPLAALTDLHRGRLLRSGAAPALVQSIENGQPSGDAKLDALIAHALLLTERPQEATRADLARLGAVGLGPADIVTLSQLVAFLAYRLRAAFGLELLETPR